MKKREPVRMTPEERKEFVLAVLSNQVFTSGHLHSHEDPGMVWLPLKMGCLAPELPELPEPPAECPDDWTVEQWEEYPEKREKLQAKLEQVAKESYEHYVNLIGGFWEYNKEALPRGVNGLPMFMSVRIMHIEDWKLTAKAITAEQERLKNISV